MSGGLYSYRIHNPPHQLHLALNSKLEIQRQNRNTKLRRRLHWNCPKNPEVGKKWKRDRLLYNRQEAFLSSDDVVGGGRYPTKNGRPQRSLLANWLGRCGGGRGCSLRGGCCCGSRRSNSLRHARQRYLLWPPAVWPPKFHAIFKRASPSPNFISLLLFSAHCDSYIYIIEMHQKSDLYDIKCHFWYVNRGLCHVLC